MIRSTEVLAALTAYEQAMRPMVEDAQGVPKIAPRLANPHSQLGIRLLHGVLNLASRPAVRGVPSKLFGGRPKDVDLSRYDAPAFKAPAIAADGFPPNRLLPLLGLVVGLGIATLLVVRSRRDGRAAG